MAIRRNHRICGALGAPPGTLYPVSATKAALPLRGQIRSSHLISYPTSHHLVTSHTQSYSYTIHRHISFFEVLLYYFDSLTFHRHNINIRGFNASQEVTSKNSRGVC